MRCHLSIIPFFSLLFSHTEANGIVRHDLEIDRKIVGHFPPPHGLGDNAVLPREFSWRNIPGVGSLLTPGGNQHIPQYCGACYAFGSMHTFQDRIKIARHFMMKDGKGSHREPDYIAAIQVLLNCNGLGCSGGSTAGAFEWVKNFQGGGVPLEGCQRYQADSFACEPENICRDCMGTTAFTAQDPQYHCFAVPADESLSVPCFGPTSTCEVHPYPRLGLRDFGEVQPFDAVAIQREIAARGPLACALDASQMLGYDGFSVLEDSAEVAAAKALEPKLNSKNLTDHIVEVVGWGVEESSGTPFWELRNSWGEYWGDGGFGKVRRGRNDLLLESNCLWVLPEGWGVPHSNRDTAEKRHPQTWQTYDALVVDAAAAALVASLVAKEASSQEAAAAIEGSSESGMANGGALFLFALFAVSVVCAFAAFRKLVKSSETANSSGGERSGLASIQLPPLRALGTPGRSTYIQI
mmetsp:Transcript_74773/g.150431  ORF Transcript_74773/g.150431 Transcript_74773/m.150431 type:complete len:466 (+) Transcript_74773:60-1457(+)